MSIVNKPVKSHTVWKRRYRARLLRESDPARFYLRRHKRKLAKRQPEPYDPTFDMEAFMATQPKTTEEWMVAMGIGQ